MASGTPVPGLDKALKSAGLESRISAASAWCDEMGARDLEEIAEEDVFQDFVAKLNLKPLEVRRLHKAIFGATAAPPPLTSGGRSSGGYCSSASSGKEPPTAAEAPTPRHSVFVKNTFLDLDDGQREQILEQFLKRSSTTPAPAMAQDDSDDGETDQDGTQASEQTEAESPPEPVGLYKTVTCDGYEPSGDWAWFSQGGDPNTMMPTMPEEVPTEAAQIPLNPEVYEHIQQEAAQMVGMVMVPAESMPPMTMPMPAGMCFPGCVPVPMDRFSRWPGDLASSSSVASASGRAQVLQRSFSIASSIHRIRWTVDARKLKSTDREAVSPQFELTFGAPVMFKMIMKPKAVSNERGGSCFKRSRGKGTVELRSINLDSTSELAVKPVVTFRIGVGSSTIKPEKIRGPVRHDFSEKPISGLPDGQAIWDFGRCVDEATQTFVVCLEVLSGY
eukprot:TRINITY_DN3974_c0_g2_i1.p1 TRINITY_DN3974_c0_g2~~TRINITY_DN3974_c0_g2_i1.p1  ORF type:complete len:478 (+),score=93.28 TRINITY_DN3974_c0_g2_i1:97-1434(+)